MKKTLERALVEDFVQNRRCFGKNKFAVFEIVNGAAVLRAASDSRRCAYYLRPGRIFVDLERQEFSVLLALEA